MNQIIRVVHILVCFSLHRDVRVCTTFHWQSYQPFCHIPQVKAHYKQLQHLPGVDTFMLDDFCRNGRTLATEQDAEKIDSVVILKGDEPIVDNLHVFYKRIGRVFIVLFHIVK